MVGIAEIVRLDLEYWTDCSGSCGLGTRIGETLGRAGSITQKWI